MQFEEFRRLGPILVVIFFFTMIYLKGTENVLLINAVKYVFTAILLVYLIILYINRYR